MSKRTTREKPAKPDTSRPRRSAKLTAKHRLKVAAEAGSDAGVWSAGDGEKPFWETKRLQDMTPSEWDSVCDGCGQCCLNKIEEEDTGRIYLTRLSCRLLDLDSCRCTDYANRFSKMPDCLSIDMKAVRKLKWLPESCGYRRLHEGRGLAWWHPLVSGDPDTVHQAGVSVRGWARSEKGIPQSDIERYIIGEAG